MYSLDGTDVLKQMRVILLQNKADPAKVGLELCVKNMIHTVRSRSASEKTFLWLSDGIESWVLRERKVFIADTPENNQLLLFGMSKHDLVLSYVIEASEIVDDRLIGNLYQIDLRDYCHRVLDYSVGAGDAMLIYEKGVQPSSKSDVDTDSSLGRFIRFEEQASSPAALHQVLSDEHRKRLIDLEQSRSFQKFAG